MNRRIAVVLLLPAIFLFSMTPKARSSKPKGQTAGKPSATRGAGSAKPDAAKSGSPKTSAAAQKWVESTLRGMTLQEKVGQVIFATFDGSFAATDSPAYAQMLHFVNDLHVGGFIVITHGTPLGIAKSQVYPTAILANQLQSKSKLPLLIRADFESGTAMRLAAGK